LLIAVLCSPDSVLICNCAAVQVRYVGQAAVRLVELFGRVIPDDQLAAAVGALDGATVAVQINSDGRVVAAVTHPHIHKQIRLLSRDVQGHLFLTNDLFRVSQTAPAGTGLRSFARQVAGARALGIHRIETYAVGDKDNPRWNGYYTLPRFGYNAALYDYEQRALRRDPQFQRLKIQDLNELFQAGGMEWWKEYGSGRSMVFTLDGRSRSVQILLRYLWSKGIISWQ
jgi:hypothetical protein